MSAHTPGPWKVAEGRDTAGPFTVRAELGHGYGLMGDYQGDIVAEVQQNPADPREGMAAANARLIAAAPELLAACKAMCDELQRQHHGFQSQESMLLAAIAKADGR